MYKWARGLAATQELKAIALQMIAPLHTNSGN